MKQLFLLLTAFILSAQAFGQQIQWSELESSKGLAGKIIPFNGDEFFAVRYSRRNAYLAYHNHLKEVGIGEINVKVPTGNGIIESVNRIGEEIVVFISDKKDGSNTLYYQRYSKDCTPTTGVEELLSYNYPKGFMRSQGYYDVRTSANGEYIALEYSLPGKRDEADLYGYKVMNKSMEVIADGEYESEYESRQFSVAYRYLTNNGEYYLLAKVYNTNERGRVRDYTSLAKTLIVRANDNGLESMEIELSEQKSVTDMTFFEDKDGNLRVNGMYGRGISYTAGIFYILVDFDKKDILNEAYNEFDKEFLTSGFTDRQKKKADKMEAKGKGTPQLYNYDFADVIINEDGSITGVLEQYYVVVTTYTDPRTGSTRTTYTYYYNDLIVYKINPEGNFEYTKKIQKRQVSVNDGGYLSSYAMYVSGADLHIFFNDNIKAYDGAGEYIQPETNREIQPTSYKKKRSVVAEVTFNTETGEMERKQAFSRTETDAYAVPKKWATDYETRDMLIYLQTGKREKFGLLKF